MKIDIKSRKKHLVILAGNPNYADNRLVSLWTFGRWG